MEFNRRKAKTLALLVAPWPDKSPKGTIDAAIAPLLDVINLHSSFFTTSSCSGRISILRQPTDNPNPNPDANKLNPRKNKKKSGGWVFVSHEAVDPKSVIEILFKSPALPCAEVMKGAEVDTLVFRFEPLIIAVECKDIMAAQELVSTAISCGFRESGISGLNKRVMVAIRCSIRLEVPLGQVGLIMVSPEYVEYLIRVANEKMEANRKRTDGFLYSLQDKMIPQSIEKAQPNIIGEERLLDLEVKGKNTVLEKSQFEQKKMQSHNQDSISYVFKNKGMHNCSISVFPLAIHGETVEKLCLWGHSASPLVSREVIGVLVFGGFGGTGHHARRNCALFLDTKSGQLKQIDAIEHPSPRLGHTSIAFGDVLYVIGGREGPMQVLNDVWVLNTAEKRWTLLECFGHTFHPRHRHATASVGSNIYTFGGLNNGIIYACMNVLNAETLSWSIASIHGETPCARHSHSMVAYGSLLLMFGGHDGQKALGDLYSFDTLTHLWKRVKTFGRSPSPRFSHSMFMYKNFAGVIGGCPLTHHSNDLSLLNLCNMTWINVPILTDGIEFWVRSSTCVIDDELIFVGGGASCYAFGTKFSFPMKTNLNLALIENFCSALNKTDDYVFKGHEISQLNGNKSLNHSGSNHEYKLNHFALQVEKKHAKFVKDILKKFCWLDLTKKVRLSLDGLHICLPISEEFKGLYEKEAHNFNDKLDDVFLEEFVLNKISVPMAMSMFSFLNASLIIDDASCHKKMPTTPQKDMREMVCSLLTERMLSLEMLEDLPVRWERLGDIVVLPVASFRDPRWDSIAKELWPIVMKSLKASRLARQGHIAQTGTRDSTLEILVGDSGWVTHLENGIFYSFDATKCMFSSGNLSEKLRIACLDCRDEVVVDLFAGIGYFTLPFLVKAKARLVYACEWNQHALKALQHNIHANSVVERCIILEGDNNLTAPTGVADRVCLGLLPSSQCSWRTAVRSLRDQGGILHIHGNVKDSEEKSWLDYTVDSIGCISLSEGRLWSISLQHVERVKSYGPHIRHIVTDIRCQSY